jgi:tetratricopeptide (TPR) repeat protein
MTRLDPKYAWSNKGVALFSQGKYDEAIKCYDEAIRLVHHNASFKSYIRTRI